MSENKTKSRLNQKFKCPLKSWAHKNGNQSEDNHQKEDKHKQIGDQLTQNKNSFIFKTANGKQIELSNDIIAKVSANLFSQQVDHYYEDYSQTNQLVPSLTQQLIKSDKSIDNCMKSEDNSLKSKTNQISKISDSFEANVNTCKPNEKKRSLYSPYISGPNTKRFSN